MASAVFSNRLKGIVLFQKLGSKVLVVGEVRGLKKNAKHGFHIHEFGDLSKGCKSLGGHFNPFNSKHGDRRRS